MEVVDKIGRILLIAFFVIQDMMIKAKNDLSLNFYLTFNLQLLMKLVLKLSNFKLIKNKLLYRFFNILASNSNLIACWN